MAGALEGIRIVDLSTVVLGPWASQMLGDMGADVIKIETPAGDLTREIGQGRNPKMASLFMATNRNKRSLVLDLTKEEGREALFRVVGTADVFLHNMRPKVAKKFGMNQEKFTGAFPKLIFVAAYGFRGEGPMADNPAYDDIIQAASGLSDLQSVASPGGEPRFVPTIIADKTTSFQVVSSILAALFHRERSGEGQAIEVPMFESLVDFIMVEHLFGAGFEPPIANMGYSRLLNKMRKPYATKDGHLAVLPYTDDNWRKLFEISGRQDLNNDPRFADLATRMKHSEEIYQILNDIIATRTTAEWQHDLGFANVPVQKVNSKEDLLNDEQLLASGFWKFINHPTEGLLRMTDPPARFTKTPSTIRFPQPLLGQQSEEILNEAGYSREQIEDFLQKGITKCPG
jgi:crotonobetainyl-CoA:carnitine CoA-transferase CaiB-like acyl-CoA transferase